MEWLADKSSVKCNSAVIYTERFPYLYSFRRKINCLEPYIHQKLKMSLLRFAKYWNLLSELQHAMEHNYSKMLLWGGSQHCAWTAGKLSTKALSVLSSLVRDGKQRVKTPVKCPEIVVTKTQICRQRRKRSIGQARDLFLRQNILATNDGSHSYKTLSRWVMATNGKSQYSVIVLRVFPAWIIAAYSPLLLHTSFHVVNYTVEWTLRHIWRHF
jgi:hypothetical protein